MLPLPHKISALLIWVLLTALAAPAQEPPRDQDRSESEAPGTSRPRRGPAGPQKEVQREVVRGGLPADAEFAVISLKHASAVELQRILQPYLHVWELSAPIIADSRMNALIVAANELGLARVRALLAQLDTPEAESPPNVQKSWAGVSLEHARAEEVAQHLSVLGVQSDQVRYAADARANTIWILGDPEAVGFVQKFVQEMEARAAKATSRRDGPARELRFYEVKHAGVEHLGKATAEIVHGMQLDLGVVADPAAGVLAAYASAAEHATLEKIISRLDVAPKSIRADEQAPEAKSKRVP